MKKAKANLGDQELSILKWIADHEPCLVREVAVHFDRELGLARTTVLTMMERLRNKGFLVRQKNNGLFQYSAKLDPMRIMQSKISEFVERTLGGEISPLVSYFIEETELQDSEIAKLEELVARLKKKSAEAADV